MLDSLSWARVTGHKLATMHKDTMPGWFRDEQTGQGPLPTSVQGPAATPFASIQHLRDRQISCRYHMTHDLNAHQGSHPPTFSTTLQVPDGKHVLGLHELLAEARYILKWSTVNSIDSMFWLATEQVADSWDTLCAWGRSCQSCKGSVYWFLRVYLWCCHTCKKNMYVASCIIER